MPTRKKARQARAQQIKLAALETSEWFRGDRITTVRPQLQQLMQFAKADSNQFHFAVFTGPESFRAILDDFVSKHGVQYIYICAHGSKGKIRFPINQKEKRHDIRIFDCLVSKTTLRGVFFGGCELKSLAEELSGRILNGRRPTDRHPWVAAYGESNDWMDGTWLDMAFFRCLFDHEKENGPVTSKKAMKAVLYSFAENGFLELVKQTDFSVYMRGEEVEWHY